MPATAFELVKDCPEPTVINADSPASLALRLMIESDFSQLPVVDEQGKPIAIITADNILRALNYFGSAVDKLAVRDAMAPLRDVDKFSLEDGIFDVLERMNTQPAVVITDQDGKLHRLVTSWDTTAYLRRRAEDTMLIEDIETALIDHIQASFSNLATGEIDELALQTAISEITNASDQTFEKIDSGLRYYLNLIEQSHKPTREAIEKAFSKLINRSSETKSLDDLTLYQYTELLLYKERWGNYSTHFSIDGPGIRKMLDEVRETRNILAHFKGEISPVQSKQLRFLANWLEQHPPAYPIPAVVTTTPQPMEEIPVENIPPIIDETDVGDSRYAKLAVSLQKQPSTVDKIRLTFPEIEEIIGGDLPPSAREHRSWWANDSQSHVQSQQWLDAGWRVSSISISDGAVTFVRAKEREAAYINFFAPLLNDLKEQAKFAVRDDTLIGTNWMIVFSNYDSSSQYETSYGFTLARGRRFRAELYLYASQVEDKRVFDLLLEQKPQIEEELGEELGWERLESTKATRVALYHPGHITDTPEELDSLRKWAVEAMIRLEKATHARVSAIVKTL